MDCIQIIDSECTSNVQCGSLQVSQSNSLIAIEEDGSCCRQLQISTIGDASLISHFTMINNQFIDNIFEAALIDTYCAAVNISSCDFNNNEKNENGASTDGCIYIDTTDLHMVTCNFNKCKVPDHGGTIYDLSDSTSNIVSTPFRDNTFCDNTIESNHGRCIALHDSSMICDKYTFYNMSSNNNGKIYADSSGSISTIYTIPLIDCSFDKSVALNDCCGIYANTKMEFDLILNHFTDSSARRGDCIFLNQSQGIDGASSNIVLSIQLRASIGESLSIIVILIEFSEFVHAIDLCVLNLANYN